MKIWTRISKPHHSELPKKQYPDLLSMTEGLRRGEAVRQIVKQHIKKYGKGICLKTEHGLEIIQSV